MKPRAALAFVAVGVLWGSAWIPSSQMLKEVPELRVGALRFTIAAVFTAALALLERLWLGRTADRISSAIFVHALVLGATALALPYALTVWASGQVSMAALPVLFALMPLVALLLGREVDSRAIPALVIGIAGVALLVAQALSIELAQAGGVLLIVCSVALGAFSLNYAKKQLRRPDLLISVVIQFAVAAVVLGSISFAVERGKFPPWSRGTLLSLVLLGVAVSGLTLPLMYWLITKLEAWQVAALQWSATLIAVAESAWFLRAKPSLEMWAGAALIVGATIWLLHAGGRRPDAVTFQITNHTGEAPAASESEVRSE